MAGTSLGRWIESLKGPTFTAREVRVFCVLVLCIAPIALIFVLRFGQNLAPDEDVAGLGGDFPAFFVAGRLLNEYPPSRLYDLHLQEQLFLEVRPDGRGLNLPFVHPPHLAVLFRPFALLPYGWAFAAWSAVSLSLYLAGLLAMIRHFGPTGVADRYTTLLLALSFAPFLVETLAGGQVSSVAFFGLALAIVNEHRRRPFVSGICLSLCAYRPTLMALLLLMLVVSRRWRILLGFAFGAGVLLALTALTMGTSTLVGYVSTALEFGQRYAGSNDVLRTWKFVDLRAFATLLAGDHAFGLAMATLAACWVLPRLVRAWWVIGRTDLPYPEGVWALAIVWTLLLNLYAPLYDCTLVVLVFILMAHTPSYRSNVPHEPAFQWLLFLSVVSPWISQIVARICGLQIFTLVLLLVAFYADRLWKRHARHSLLLPDSALTGAAGSKRATGRGNWDR